MRSAPLAESFRNASDVLNVATRHIAEDLKLPDDAFLGDPYSKWAIEQFNAHFVDNNDSLANTLVQLTREHMRTFALKAAAESYDMTDQWNARNLGEAYELA